MDIRDIMENSMGYSGFEYINDTAVHTAPSNRFYCAIQVISDAVFSAIVPAPTGNTFTGEVIPTGTILYGNFQSITLTSGKVIAYKGV